jgi:hypothetical protein
MKRTIEPRPVTPDESQVNQDGTGDFHTRMYPIFLEMCAMADSDPELEKFILERLKQLLEDMKAMAMRDGILDEFGEYKAKE